MPLGSAHVYGGIQLPRLRSRLGGSALWTGFEALRRWSSCSTTRLLQDPALFPGDPTSHGWAWWVIFSPVHLVWDGTEAVFVFFVLSGYVLTLPMVGRRRDLAGWLAYYPQRLLRLYLPVFASVVLAVLSYVVVRRHVVTDATSWLSAHAGALTPAGVVHDLTLVRGTTWVNSALWSLKWEVVFSVLLPVYIAAAVVARRWWWLKVVAAACGGGRRGARRQGVADLPADVRARRGPGHGAGPARHDRSAAGLAGPGGC